MTFHGNSTWSEEQDRDLARLWQEGCSASIIAEKIIGKSRNAVIGRIHRLRGRGETFSARSSHAHRRPRSASRPPQAPRPRLRQTLQRQVRAPVAPPVVILKLNEREPDGSPVNLMELCSAACKWPVTENGPHMFCNKVRRGDGPYCDEHAAKSFDQAHRTAIDKSSKPSI